MGTRNRGLLLLAAFLFILPVIWAAFLLPQVSVAVDRPAENGQVRPDEPAPPGGQVDPDAPALTLPNGDRFAPRPGVATAAPGEIGPGACAPERAFVGTDGSQRLADWYEGRIAPAPDPMWAHGSYDWLVAHKDHYAFTPNPDNRVGAVAAWHRDKTVTMELPYPITIMNTYCDQETGRVVFWEQQTLPKGEPVVFLKGHEPGNPHGNPIVPVRKAVCENFLLPPDAPVPAPAQAAPAPAATTAPVTFLPPAQQAPVHQPVVEREARPVHQPVVERETHRPAPAAPAPPAPAHTPPPGGGSAPAPVSVKQKGTPRSGPEQNVRTDPGRTPGYTPERAETVIATQPVTRDGKGTADTGAPNGHNSGGGRGAAPTGGNVNTGPSQQETVEAGPAPELTPVEQTEGSTSDGVEHSGEVGEF